MPDFADPKFKKYKMLLKMHLPRGAVEQKMAADGLGDLTDEFFDYIEDPDTHPTAGGGSDSGGSGEGGTGAALKIKDDPKFAKYFKMLKMHLPRGAVEQKMAADGVDTSILDEDPEGISPNSPPGSTLTGGGGGSSSNGGNGAGAATSAGQAQTAGSGGGGVLIQRGVPNKNDVLGFRVSRDQFVLAMCMASGLLTIGGNDVAAVGVTPPSRAKGRGGSSSDGSRRTSGSDGGRGGSGVLKVRDDPAFTKYFKMLKMHLPRGAVAQKMVADGLSSDILDMDPDEPSPNQPESLREEKEKGSLRDDPKMQKFFKMAKLHLPEGAIRQKMMADGIPEELQDDFFEGSG